MSQAARTASSPESEDRAIARPPDGAPRPRPGRDRPPEPRPRTRIGRIGPVRRTIILVALAVAVTSTAQSVAGRHSGTADHRHAVTAGQAADTRAPAPGPPPPH